MVDCDGEYGAQLKPTNFTVLTIFAPPLMADVAKDTLDKRLT